MPNETLTLDNIGNIDKGTLRIAVNKAFKLVTQDMADRPALNRTRKVTLVMELKPVMDTQGSHPELESVDVAWQVSTKMPAQGSRGVVMKPKSDGQLYFHSELPQDPDDETLMDEADRRRQEREDRGGDGR